MRLLSIQSALGAGPYPVRGMYFCAAGSCAGFVRDPERRIRSCAKRCAGSSRGSRRAGLYFRGTVLLHPTISTV